MRGLTKRQLEVAQFIENYFDTNGYAPSVRNIADHFGFSPKAAYDHMTALKKKNVIRTAENLPRGMALIKRTTPGDSVVLKVPLVGTTAAGEPIFSEENYDGYVAIPQSLAGVTDTDNLYALRVRGDSMINDGINDGDLAIMFKTKVAKNGDIVAASIGDDESYGITLKRFFHNADRYELRPANPAYQRLVSTHCDVHGKLIMIIRNYK
ncbi:MAG: transcriptional repressor LexA [Sphaerochaetaceae bacterium]|nr:transcriptional repressor LexA [Sphaerochaetaceae bacterium]